MGKKSVLLAFLFLSACATADIVQSPGRGDVENGPTNEASRPGVVKYLNHGADFVIQQRRKDAYLQMRRACRGKYKIISESPMNDGGMIMPVGRLGMVATSQYWYITFQCEESD